MTDFSLEKPGKRWYNIFINSLKGGALIDR